MKAGNFNINDYLEKLYENAEGGQLPDKEGMVIPEENQKAYQWLKKEYQKAQTEVKVEINMGGSKFEPGYDLQTDLKSVKDFKPGMFGEVKTADTKGEKKTTGNNLDPKKGKPGFQKEEGEKKEGEEGEEEKDEKKPTNFKSKPQEKSIKDKQPSKDSEESDEEKPEKKETSDEDETKVKKIDLKTKKK